MGWLNDLVLKFQDLIITSLLFIQPINNLIALDICQSPNKKINTAPAVTLLSFSTILADSIHNEIAGYPHAQKWLICGKYVDGPLLHIEREC